MLIIVIILSTSNHQHAAPIFVLFRTIYIEKNYVNITGCLRQYILKRTRQSAHKGRAHYLRRSNTKRPARWRDHYNVSSISIHRFCRHCNFWRRSMFRKKVAYFERIEKLSHIHAPRNPAVLALSSMRFGTFFQL